MSPDSSFPDHGNSQLFSQGNHFSNFESSIRRTGSDRKVYLDTVGGTPITDATYTATLLRGSERELCSGFPRPSRPSMVVHYRDPRQLPLGQPTTLAVQIARAGTVVATSPTFAYTPPLSDPAPGEFLMINFRAFAVPEPHHRVGRSWPRCLVAVRRRK